VDDVRPDDPRHGTVAGHVAHQREGGDYCQACVTAKAMYDKRRVWDAANGRAYTVPSVGARRRIQALLAVGWSRPQVAREAGWETSGALRYVMRSDTMTRATHDRIAETYERLCMRPPPNEMVARRVKTWARKGGYAPPLAWLNIDDPDEQPAVRPVVLHAVRERTYDTPDHRACARCGVVREVHHGRGDLCHDCRTVTREAGAA
jgi:hypothetical protein